MKIQWNEHSKVSQGWAKSYKFPPIETLKSIYDNDR